jgi:hypothetical protein
MSLMNDIQRARLLSLLEKQPMVSPFSHSDYDMKGYIEKYGEPDQSKGQHLTDEFKLPNHITFSGDSKYSNPDTPGGKWEKKNGKWSFTPSMFNIEQHGIEKLKEYFEKYEKDAVLNLKKPVSNVEINDTQRARMLSMIEKQRQGLQEPWIDPVTAAAGGFGGSLPSTLKALTGKTGLKALVRPFIAAVSGAAADYPLGKATEVVEDVSPALAMPFNIAAGMGSGALANKAIKAGSNVMKLRSMGVLPPIKNPTANELGMVEAWHGSPHKFDKFDSSKIGTGEGAQAFGHGLYFTDKKEIARHYANMLSRNMPPSPTNIKIDGKSVPWREKITELFGGEYLKDLDKKYEISNHISPITKEQWLRTVVMPRIREKMSLGRNELDRVNFDWDNRNLYKVTLNKGKDDVWLDWDKPLSKQSDVVKKAIGYDGKKKFNKEAVRTGIELVVDNDYNLYKKRNIIMRFVDKYLKNPEDKAMRRQLNHYLKSYDAEDDAGMVRPYLEFLEEQNSKDLGKNFYKELATKLGSEPNASKKLKEMGIDGIRYPTESLSGPRQSDKFNYVVFDDNAVEIDDKISY